MERLILSGTATLSATGNDGDNALNGNAAANALRGLGGDDVIDGGAGANSLWGHAGADCFAFSSALGGGNVDAIKDFDPLHDTIRLDRSVFAALGPGPLDADAFRVAGAEAADAEDRIVYNATTGDLFYDAGGTGTGAAVRFAVLETRPALTHEDFLVSA